MDSLGEIRVFVEVVRAGSFAAAARVLAMTPSGASRTVGRLEERLGVRLLNRTTRSMTLTEPGRLLFERGERIMEEVEAAETLTRDHSDTPRGRLRVAATDAFTILVLVPFLKGFLERHPQLSVTTTQGDGEVDLLGEGVDVAIRFERPSSTSFIAKKITDDPYVIVASPDYIERHGVPQTPYELREHRCLNVHARRRTTSRWGFCKDEHEEFIHIDGVFSGIGLAVREAVLAGLGVARLAAYVVRPEIESGALVPLLTDYTWGADRAIWAIYPHREHLASKTRVFVDELSEFSRKAAPRLSQVG
ncbi:LysR family transcriptional regulator [Parvularcula dongshanensis]|uniref:DNA-binding transcriptional LysR family regulator n=1 Tax=Parvularcula dongshanensis TaxID=1173995 RepID=A0A840I8M0_9PROT|nr:LysR family transcriptional regulator [Parvularcula dongshanensis]MBB4660300.1 DNA-binding transcriptional LysR family regulator [Parvularcula dongshanensis]